MPRNRPPSLRALRGGWYREMVLVATGRRLLRLSVMVSGRSNRDPMRDMAAALAAVGETAISDGYSGRITRPADIRPVMFDPRDLVTAVKVGHALAQLRVQSRRLTAMAFSERNPARAAILRDAASRVTRLTRALTPLGSESTSAA